MAYPFGNHPTLGEYIVWAQEQGCQSLSGYTKGYDTSTTIRAPNGRRVIVADMQQDEKLTPTKVGYLDKRLGLDSPFSKLPE